MREIKRYICDICHQEYQDIVDATKCELQGIPAKHFEVGQKITLQVGEKHESFTIKKMRIENMMWCHVWIVVLDSKIQLPWMKTPSDEVPDGYILRENMEFEERMKKEEEKGG